MPPGTSTRVDQVGILLLLLLHHLVFLVGRIMAREEN